MRINEESPCGRWRQFYKIPVKEYYYLGLWMKTWHIISALGKVSSLSCVITAYVGLRLTEQQQWLGLPTWTK